VIVVPIFKDVIKTKDDAKYRVVEYTNYKESGPAVYARETGSKTNSLIYFIDIAEINGTKVEYQRGTKVFEALGKVSREQPLPQPDDKIILLNEAITDEDGKEKAEVEGLKLKSKALGINKGMFVKDTEGRYYRLKQILDIKPSIGSTTFNRDRFLAIYKDYTGV
jgi:hypothetical protein